jgi:hypothetical protein
MTTVSLNRFRNIKKNPQSGVEQSLESEAQLARNVKVYVAAFLFDKQKSNIAMCLRGGGTEF